jgi:hypothetical protein
MDMDPSFPSSTDPLLTPTTSESQLTAQNQQQIMAKKKKAAFTVSPQDSPSHIQFRIG